jgi:hypothetical protein
MVDHRQMVLYLDAAQRIGFEVSITLVIFDFDTQTTYSVLEIQSLIALGILSSFEAITGM